MVNYILEELSKNIEKKLIIPSLDILKVGFKVSGNVIRSSFIVLLRLVKNYLFYF